ncbi:MAG: hypothetical protein P8106_04140 [Gammaproteobacteria bacterium]|jgi:hypothetical protein
MTRDEPKPGVTRDHRISAEGLRRLETQLTSGARIGDAVLAQWLKRYGEPARRLLRRHGYYHEALEPDSGSTPG